MKIKLSHIIQDSIAESIDVKKMLIEKCMDSINSCGNKIAGAVKSGNKVLLCGNGGSAADSQHIAAELVVRFRSNINRAAIPAIALTVDPSIMTAGGNDIGFDNVFAREVEAYGRPGDVLIGISTSGNSPNVLKAIQKAKEQKMVAIGLLGNGGGVIAPLCDECVIVPAAKTARIQECHILIGHIWCEMLEEFNYPELFK